MAMANYVVDVDFTMSKRINIDAESEEQAKSIVERMIRERPYDFACNFDSFVGSKVIDVNEDV